MGRIEPGAADAFDALPVRVTTADAWTHRPNTTRERRDRGFTPVESVAILAIIAVAVAFSVGSATDRDDVSACRADAGTLTQSADAYLTRERVEVLPAMGFSANRYELALIDTGLHQQGSTTCDLLADGTVTIYGQPCT